MLAQPLLDRAIQHCWPAKEHAVQHPASRALIFYGARRCRVRVSFKAPWRSGTAHADMDAHQFLTRLCALVPPPGRALRLARLLMGMRVPSIDAQGRVAWPKAAPSKSLEAARQVDMPRSASPSDLWTTSSSSFLPRRVANAAAPGAGHWSDAGVRNERTNSPRYEAQSRS